MSNDFEKITYEELEQLVTGHRNGDKNSTRKLLQAWDRWLQKYINLLYRGRLIMTDKNLRDFIALYMPMEHRKRIHQFMRNAYSRIDIEKTVDTMRLIFSNLQYHEIENEVKLAFLTLAKRYKSQGNYFHIYVNRSFHYQLHRQLKLVANMEAVAAVDGGHLSFWDPNSEGEDGQIYGELINEAKSSRYYVHECDDDINENWINGLTTSEAFDELTKTQRRILKLYYTDGHTDEEIAEMMGTCRATINRRRQKAIRTIKPYFEQQRVIIA